MKSIIGPQLGANRSRLLRERLRAVTHVHTHVTPRAPAMARDIQPQSAEGGVFLTWKLPTRNQDVSGYRVYVGDERNLAVQIRDRGTRQAFIPLTSGAAPPVTNVFVSVVNGFREGPKQQVQVTAQANTNTPGVKPPPPTGYLEEFAGGLDKTQSGMPSKP